MLMTHKKQKIQGWLSNPAYLYNVFEFLHNIDNVNTSANCQLHSSHLADHPVHSLPPPNVAPVEPLERTGKQHHTSVSLDPYSFIVL